MFRESLEECAERGHRRRWATLTSFAVQIAAACVLLVLPLLYPEALPFVHADAAVLMPVPSGGPPHTSDPTPVNHLANTTVQREDSPVIRAPQRIPVHTDTSPDPVTETASACIPPCVIGAPPDVGARSMSPILRDILATTNIHAVVKPQTVNSIRLSPGVSQGFLIARIEPRYPEPARRARIQGDVLLAAMIGRDGRIENLHVVEGHPMLAQAALDAVRQWRYRPYMLGSEAVEVETQIRVQFRLTGGD